jgi:hypothetical protein
VSKETYYVSKETNDEVDSQKETFDDFGDKKKEKFDNKPEKKKVKSIQDDDDDWGEPKGRCVKHEKIKEKKEKVKSVQDDDDEWDEPKGSCYKNTRTHARTHPPTHPPIHTNTHIHTSQWWVWRRGRWGRIDENQYQALEYTE